MSGIEEEDAGRKHTFLGFDLRGVVKLVPSLRFELRTSCLQGKRSTTVAITAKMAGKIGFEPMT